MIHAWRLVKRDRAGEAFTGDGARRYGGRWNHRGTAVVYVSESLALAALELFVHLGAAYTNMVFATFRVEIPDKVERESLNRESLPGNWREQPPPDSSKTLGTEWLNRGRTAVLRVPSVIVPSENNYLLNPGHADFKKVRRERQRDFTFDPRMWK